MLQRVSVVIPSIRTVDFLNDWERDFKNADIIIVEDAAKKSIKPPKIQCNSLIHYDHSDMEKELGELSWIFPWKSAAVRSYGFYKAWQNKADVIISLDDDCYPDTPDFIHQHLQNLETKLPTDWCPTYPFREELFTRGFPYLNRAKIQTALSHGLWSEVPDFDGITQLMSNGKTYPQLPPILHIIPPGMFFPMSGMNLAFRAEITPLMYQLVMGFKKNGQSYGYDRFDDIWSGIFAKKVLDHLNFGAVSGSPFVRHARASNVFTNIKKEATGIEKNEVLWQAVAKVKLKSKTVVGAYKELMTAVELPKEEYFTTLRKAILQWLTLFE